MNPQTSLAVGPPEVFGISFITSSPGTQETPSSLPFRYPSLPDLLPRRLTRGDEASGREGNRRSPILSVVIPVFNEDGNVIPLAREILTSLENLTGGVEIIFVDDASTDSTAQSITSAGLAGVKVVRHRINAGQSAAVGTGFRSAEGEWVATLDGDGQNDPADLAALLATALREQADCVTGVRINRMDTRIRRLSSIIANAFRNLITGDQVIDSGCGIRVMRRSALKEIPIFNGMHRFLPTLLRGQGYLVLEQTVNHRERTKGVSKYGVGNRLWRGIRDCFGVRWYLSRSVPSNRCRGEDRARG